MDQSYPIAYAKREPVRSKAQDVMAPPTPGKDRIRICTLGSQKLIVPSLPQLATRLSWVGWVASVLTDQILVNCLKGLQAVSSRWHFQEND